MRPTFLGLETTKRGIMVNQKALDIVSNNISNVKTPGYTRQRLDMVSVQVTGQSHLNNRSIPLAGQGVDALGVRQIRNSFLDSRFRQEYGDVGYYDQNQVMLSEIEAAISDPETEGTGLANAMENLLTTLTKFSENPYQETQGDIVKNAFTEVTHILNQYDRKLETIAQQQKEDLQLSVNDINTKLKQVAELNKAISDQIFNVQDYDGVNYGPNDLLDQRNLILDDLARYGSLQVTNRDSGEVEVHFNGRTVIGRNGDYYSADTIQVGSDGISLTWTQDNSQVHMDTGILRAYTDVLKGSTVSSKGIPYYQDQLDIFARQFADAFNNVIPNDNGAVGFKGLLEGGIDGTLTAGNISISSNWLKDPTYVIQRGNPDGDGDNTHVLEAKKLLDADLGFDGTFTGNFTEYITFITTGLGSDISLNESRLDTAVSTAESVDEDRMATSGVSINEEGIQMMTYNKAYQALARLMTAMDEQLDVLINKTGLVGR